jgi:hypothetical protein
MHEREGTLPHREVLSTADLAAWYTFKCEKTVLLLEALGLASTITMDLI